MRSSPSSRSAASWSWRGQGLSARELPNRLKGHARGYEGYLGDFAVLLAAFESRLPRPWVAVGHSMGGALTLLAMAKGERRIAGAALSAPMLGVNTGKVTPGQARLAARIHTLLGRAGRYVRGQPGKPLDDDFEANILTHDRARFERTCGLLAAEPQLALGGPTWGWLDFAFRATDYLARPDRLRQVSQPVVIVSAEDDRLVDNAAQAAAARHLPQGKLILAPGAYHEILMETDSMRNIFLRAFDALTGRVAPKPAAAPRAAEPVSTPERKPQAEPAPSVAAVQPAPAPAKPKPAAKPKAAAKPAAVTAKAPAKAAVKPATKPVAKAAAVKTSPPKAPAKKAPAKKATKPT